MIDVAADAGVRLMANQNYRYRRAPRTVRKLILEGTEGEIHWADNAVTLKPQSVFTSVFVPGAREARGRLAFDLVDLAAEDRQGSLAAFRDAVLNGKDGETSGRDNLRTLATVLAVRLSIERGETVTLDEVLSSPAQP